MLPFWLAALLLGGATVPTQAAPAAALPQSAYGKIVSQSYDKIQQVTETHLANGLTILSKESHAAPVVYFSVWYKVGSRNEITGETGLSHILEHMMFKGTKDLPPGAIDHLFLNNGGEINASTAEDRTEYHELIAADRLELAIRVEADRMENSAFDPTELKHEMTVVRSELEGDSNDPSFELYAFAFLPTAFSAHPYHWPTIGWTSDVEAVADRRDVIYGYYKDHYMPSNAVVVMVGDFDTAKAVALCQQYFGVYPLTHPAEHHITPEPAQRGPRRIVLERPGTTGHVLIGYHEPGTGTPDHYVMDVISQILNGGRSARLYQDLVETGVATEATAGADDHRDPYLFVFDATPRSGVTNAALEKAMGDEIAKLQAAPPTAEEVARAVHQIEASFVYQNDSVSDQAGQIGYYSVIHGYQYLDTYLDRIRQVTPTDVQRVAKTYFVTENSTVATFEPQPIPAGEPPPPPAGEKNFGAVPPITDPKQKAMLDALDRRFNSESHASIATKRPAPTRTVLPNGLVVIVEENHSNHTVALSGLTRAGSMYDPDGKWGLAEITAEMLPRGTESKTALQLALGLESVGAEVTTSADTEAARFGGQCLSKDFGLTLGTLADELRHPAFPADQLEKVRGMTLSGLEEARQDTGGTSGPGTQAEIAFADSLFPRGHPFWMPTLDQSEAAVKSLTADDVRSFYGAYYRPDTTALVIVGDVTTSDALQQIRTAFGDWVKPSTPRAAFAIPDVPLPTQAPPTQMLPLSGASQTSILWGYPGQLKRTDPDFYPTYVMSFILGGDPFQSRLGRTIRDKSGLAYNVYSYFDATHGAGALQVFLGTNPNNADRAIYDLRQVVGEMRRGGVTADEVRDAKLYLTGSYPLRLETNAGVAGQLLNSEDFGLGLDFIQRRAAIINAVTVAQVNAAIQRHLFPDRAVLTIAGAVPPR
jgi:zinc protease